MFMGTFTGTTLQWFSGILDGHITSFSQFSTVFREKFSANKVKPPRIYDIFSVKQREGESLKDYLNRFSALTVNLQTHDEDMMITTFKQGITTRPFNDSLIKNPVETFFEVWERVVAHIKAKEVVVRKNNSSHLRQPRPKESVRARPLRVNETSTKKRINSRYMTYVAKSDEPKTKAREDSDTQPKFRVSYKELLSKTRVADKLKFSQKTNRNLGARRDA